ncbi:acetyl-CoA hydrolase/transferase family protein [Arundinibacter roseus]|uniref:Acetyl-CoA hydrolase/transferase family protein n=1 Tax=Arundinibacter roseus TaxID=2070510 RepID=A0A4R4KCX3_9BACT|nr:acetyl-CoA hydrolase/transferase C-terminal domain-containing protein [Arundinibacter roseus]TDB64169.1 acetyl-CoA hydrolase/transferase family protein [Arundinibacter roseus]
MNYSFISVEKAVSLIKSNDRVFVHGAAATPTHLLQALAARASELRNVQTIHLHLEGPMPLADAGNEESFHPNALFIGANLRAAVAAGRASYMPIFLSEAPLLFRHNIWPLDVALVQVSPPDQHGFCSLGVSVDVARAAVDTAPTVIAMVNPQMPRTHGDGQVHVSKFTALCFHETPIYAHEPTEPTPLEMAIGRNVAELVEDGATLQVGIGGIPNATLRYLHNHKNLGLHTEMFSDGIIDLVEKGIINGSQKKKHRGKLVSSFAVGSQRLYKFMDDNPMISMLEASYTNDTAVIRTNPRVTAINSAIEVDLTGQICADSIGTRLYSGVGGQMDFIRGASLSAGGKPIIALPSVTSRGESKIVQLLKEGAGVVTTRAHAHYIVTENGVADLYGKTLKQRAQALIAIAHADHQEALEKAAFTRFGPELISFS